VIYIAKVIQTASFSITKQLGRDLSPVLALIDTGDGVCLVNKGLIPKRFLQPAKRRLHLIGANGRVVQGGDTEVKLVLNLTGVDTQTNKKEELHIPTVLYEADIQDDVIPSYSWCQLRSVEFQPREHGTLCVSKE